MNCSNILVRLIRVKGYPSDYAIEYLVKAKDDILVMREKPENRECYACGATTSYIDKSGLMHWRFNYDATGRAIHVLCSRCNNRYIENPLRNPIAQHKRITFGESRISLSHNPRTGFCSKCGRTDIQTHMHHEQYDLNDPVAHTVELCCQLSHEAIARIKAIRLILLSFPFLLFIMPATTIALNHPLYPKPELVALHKENNYPYREKTVDKKYNRWYNKVKKKPTKITSLVTQIYRVRVLNAVGEKIMYHETLTGLDHNDNELDFDHLAGRWERPIFRKQYDEETDDVISQEIKDHEIVYDIPYSA